jgi:hypothetical protein
LNLNWENFKLCFFFIVDHLKFPPKSEQNHNLKKKNRKGGVIFTWAYHHNKEWIWFGLGAAGAKPQYIAW